LLDGFPSLWQTSVLEGLCPTNVSSYCAGNYAAALSNTTDIAVTAYATKFGFVDCTGSVCPSPP
jgi:hypothetical protein